MEISLSYKDLPEPSETINIISDRTEIKEENIEGENVEKNEEESIISPEYESFLEECKSIEEKNKEEVDKEEEEDKKEDKESKIIDISIFKRFIDLFTENPCLSFEPLLSTNFIDLLSSQILKITETEEEDFNELDDTIFLLQSLKILLSSIMFKDKFHCALFNFIAPCLIYLISNKAVSNVDNVEIVLECLLLISKNNIINRLCISQLDQEDIQLYIEKLWAIFSEYLAINDDISRYICQMIIEIYGTFYCNPDQFCISIVFKKLNTILLQSQNYSILSIDEIKRISSFSYENLKTMLENHAIQSIQIYLMKLGNDYQKLLHFIRIKEKEENQEETQEEEEEEENEQIENIEFELFLKDYFFNEDGYLLFDRITEISEVIYRSQITLLSILTAYSDNLLFNEFDSKLIYEILKKLDFKRSPELYMETVRFLIRPSVSFKPFSDIFCSDLTLIKKIIQYTEKALYNGKIESCLLFTQLIRNGDEKIISDLIDKNIVSQLIQTYCELQEESLFNEITEILLKLIDFGFAEKIKDDLLNFSEYIEEMTEQCENEEEVQWRNQLLLKKMENIFAEAPGDDLSQN